ncbi:hypothetical protein QOZ71_30200, partial [Pseudomonas aeruginosa]
TSLPSAKMSFQNFDSFQNQADAAAAAPAPADAAMAGQDAAFQGHAGDAAAAAVPQQGADGKTTLWYVSDLGNARFMR